ncbi:potassium channel family protein [Thermosediminibacter oceani]|uniref:TrkA-N domain protein n=1 Tax=Thermosediminibacter oceani (strain ATCC BAA-1034 / DSM 16646 / JW/IW-1228P) TaxID=555079 RepID=D9RXT0_THEOJ|nr:TrkA family potassium uptake protein [Thermosediminibacter oceani]ADL08154.1 TrkA-N domain protein [Thermosediminibacter oceani DSM 16646]
MKKFVVIGLSTFGISIIATLMKLGYEVLAVDKDEDRVKDLSEIINNVVIADATKEETLKALGIKNYDAVIVSIGQNFQASVLITMMLNEMGVKKIIVKTDNELYSRALKKVGANVVIFPEGDMGSRIAKSLPYDNIRNFVELAENACLAEIGVTRDMRGKTLRELNLSQSSRINVLGIKKNGWIEIMPSPDEVLSEEDTLLVLGPGENLCILGDRI